MSKNLSKKKQKINLIPLFILIGLIIVIYFVFLSDSEIFQLDKNLEVTRLNGFPAVAYTQKELDKQRLVITTEEELANFLNYVDESGYLIVREDVDFNKEMLLGVSTSVNEFEGHTIKIRKLYKDRDSNTLIVSLRETESGAYCELIPNDNVAIDLVSIDITGMKVEFERVKEVKDCE